MFGQYVTASFVTIIIVMFMVSVALAKKGKGDRFVTNTPNLLACRGISRSDPRLHRTLRDLRRERQPPGGRGHAGCDAARGVGKALARCVENVSISATSQTGK